LNYWSGAGEAIASLATFFDISPILFGWLVAAMICAATGSSTVAMTAEVGIVLPIISSVPGVILNC
jgi:gluconate:H+ symporter, GntP family